MRLIQHASVLPLLALVASAASFAACAKEETPASGQAWSCGKEDVPGGESIRCVQSALVVGGPSDTSGGAGSGTADAGTGSTSYDCTPGSTNPDCPPSDGSLGSQTGSSSTGGAGSGTSDGNPPVDSNGGSASTGGAGSGTSDGNPPGTSQTGSASNGGAGSGTSDGNPPGTSQTGSASNGGGGSGECAYTEDLPYCNPSSSTADGGTSGSGGSSDCTLPNCKVPPGQEKKGSSNGQSGENSSGGTPSDGTPGTKKPYHCTKDDKGNKSCLSEPTCAPGSHPAPCGACVTDDESSSDCVPPDAGGCWVTGGGFIEAASLVPPAPADGHDNYGGNAKPMKDGTVKGHWNHVDHGTGNHALGRPEYLFCRHVDEPGPGQPGGKKGLTSNQVYFGGHARWRSNDVWEDGYWFDVVAKDHGEPGSVPKPSKNGGMVDTYHFTIRKIVDPANLASGTVVYETKGDLVGGNIQIHPSNGGHPAVQSPLPSWVSLEP